MTKLALLILLLTTHTLANDGNTLAKIEAQINRSLQDKIQLSLEKEELQSRINEMQARLKERKLLIARRMKATQTLQRFQWGELLTDTNVTELERNMRILRSLNKYDYSLFREYRASLKLLAENRSNLQETEKLISANVEALQRQEQEFLLVEKIRIESLQKSKSRSLLVHKGTLARPLAGLPAQEFGLVRDQFNQFYLINRGELYRPRTEMVIHAVGPGKVIFRDDLSPWRETLVVQHDDNYYSVYAGLQKVAKNVGDAVTRNERLATSAGKEFYFELRHYDNPINPKTWYR